MKRALAVLIVLAAGCAKSEPSATAPPAPPLPQRMDELDPALFDRITVAAGRVEADPGDAAARLELGLVYAANGLNESARLTLEQVVARDGAPARAWYHLARVRAELGDLDGAIQAMDRAAKLAPDYAPARWQSGLWLLDRGDVDAAEAAFREAVRVQPDTSAGRLGLARVALARKEFELAAEQIEAYMDDTGWNREYASHLLAEAYRGLDRLDDAAEALRLAGEALPVWHDPWRAALADYAEGYQAELERAKRKAATGDLDGAIAILEALRRSREVTVEVYNNLALSYMGVRETERALEVLEEGIALNPNSLEANHLLAGACWLLSGREGIDPQAAQTLRRRALSHVRAALEINPAYVPALGLLGDLRAAAGDVSGALETYREAARWDPDNPQWPYQVALVHGSLRQWDQVVTDLEAVVEMDPVYADALGRLGLAYIAVGRYDDAERALTRALSLNPEHTEMIQAALDRLAERRTSGS